MKSFKLTIDVDEYVELELRTAFTTYDQRENDSYTDYRRETKQFQSVEQAKIWLLQNPKAQVVQASLVKNITQEFVQ